MRTLTLEISATASNAQQNGLDEYPTNAQNHGWTKCIPKKNARASLNLHAARPDCREAGWLLDEEGRCGGTSLLFG